MEIYFVLVRPKYSGNIGNVARVIKNFGFKKLVLIEPTAEIDYDAWLYAVHAKDVLYDAKIYNSIQEFIDEERVKFLIGTTARIGGEKNPLRTPVLSNRLREVVIPDTKIAVLFGNEESGLTNDELMYCDLVVTIPTSEEYPVMNLSHAVAIIAYELSLLISEQRMTKHRPANIQEREILIKELENLVEKVVKSEEKLPIYKGIMQNLVKRAFLTGREAHTLIGIFKKIRAMLDECSDENQPS